MQFIIASKYVYILPEIVAYGLCYHHTIDSIIFKLFHYIFNVFIVTLKSFWYFCAVYLCEIDHAFHLLLHHTAILILITSMKIKFTN